MTAIHRRPGAASVAALGVITLSVAAAHAVAPNWSRSVGLDVWRYSEYAADLRQCHDRRKELAAGHERLFQQMDVGDRLAAGLIDAHVSLADAADEIGRVNQDRTGFADTLRWSFGDGTSPRQRFARYLLVRARSRLEDAGDPSRLAEVTARLEAEYRAMPPAP
jgi:hypothetical protein